MNTLFLDLEDCGRSGGVTHLGVPEIEKREPRITLEQEQGWHRLACTLCASGMTNKQIALELDKSEAQVGLVLRQPRSRSFIANCIHQNYNDEIAGVLKGAAVEAILVMKDLMTGAESDTVRQRAASDILDRHLGKATQRVEHQTTTAPVDAKAEIAKLEAELKLPGGAAL